MDVFIGKDVIVRLERKYQYDAVKLIFGYLSFDDLKNAANVSFAWRQLIFSSVTLWKNLLSRNIQSIPEWAEMHRVLISKHSQWLSKLNDVESYRWMCFEIANALQRVEANWQMGYYTSRQVECKAEYLCDTRGTSFVMNSKHVFRFLSSKRGIALFNRWTLELEHIFEYPLLTVNDETNQKPYCLQANDEFVIASYTGNSICIWNLATKELVWKIVGSGLISETARNNRQTLKLRGSSLIYHCEIPAEYFDDDLIAHFDGRLVSMHCFSRLELTESGLTSKELRPLFQQENVDNSEERYSVMDFDFNESHILLFYLKHNVEPHYEYIDIKTLEVLWDVSIPCLSNDFDNICIRTRMTMSCNGLFITGFEDKQLRIWNITTTGAETVGHLEDAEGFQCAEFVQDKYIVTVNSTGHIKIWDLRSALLSNPVSIGDNLLIDCLLGNKMPNEDEVIFHEMYVDKFQVVVNTGLSIRDWYSFWKGDKICVLDFVDDPNVEQLEQALSISSDDGTLEFPDKC